MIDPASLGSVRVRVLGAVACFALVLSGCGVQGLNFREDTRLRITAPEDRSQVRLPVTVEWEVTDFTVTGPSPESTRDEGYFAVFVDRAPQPPGESLEWFARDDEGCMAARGCPDEDWLTQRRIYTATQTSFTLDAVPRRTDDRREFHEVVIIFLDGHGQRIGESAFAVEFEVVRST